MVDPTLKLLTSANLAKENKSLDLYIPIMPWIDDISTFPMFDDFGLRYILILSCTTLQIPKPTCFFPGFARKCLLVNTYITMERSAVIDKLTSFPIFNNI